MGILETYETLLGNLIMLIPQYVTSFCTFITRFIFPVLMAVVLSRCIRSMLREKYDGEEWGHLTLPNGSIIKLEHWENIIGRSKSSDVRLDYPTLSRSHAALIRDDKANWTLYDLHSKGGVRIMGKDVKGSTPIKSGDAFNLGGVDMTFVPISAQKERELALNRRKPGRDVKAGTTLLFLTVFQVLLAVQLSLSLGDKFTVQVPASFLGLTIIMWLCYGITRAVNRLAFEVETIAFLLCTVGFAVGASSVPTGMFKQLAMLTAGVLLYFGIGWFLRDLDRAKKLRWPAAAAGLLLLAVNLVASEAVFGAKNWLEIGGFSFQPSEFVKIAFVLAGAATLDRLFARRNLIMFIGFAAACVGALALMSDFGTALVFFAAYLVIAFLRSGNIATIFLSVAGAGFAGFIAITLKSHIAARFASWGHAWEYAYDSGYQQTRTMSAAASGGLFGEGAGKGWLKTVFAADTDMVFGMVCEEMGLIAGLLIIAALVVFAFFSIKMAATSRSSFYVIGACASVSIMLMQTILNVLGSLDILPFTGVTLPFVSKGGSSLIACWGLLTFIKAVDTRQNASFVIKAPQKSDAYAPDPVGDFRNVNQQKNEKKPVSIPKIKPPSAGQIDDSATLIFKKETDITPNAKKNEDTKDFGIRINFFEEDDDDEDFDIDSKYFK